MFADLTSVTQGSLGLTAAIYNLSKLGYVVSIPLIDNQNYDLIIDKEGILYKVEVKTSRTKAASGNYVVQIKSVRSNKTDNNIKNFDSSAIDYLFILLDNESMYFIPSKEVKSKTTLTLSEKHNIYKL